MSKYFKISNIRLKMQPLLPNLWSFSLLNLEKQHFLGRIHIEYFHLSFFVILGVYLIKKYGCHTQAFFSLFQSFSGCRVPGLSYIIFRFWSFSKSWSIINFHSFDVITRAWKVAASLIFQKRGNSNYCFDNPARE